MRIGDVEERKNKGFKLSDGKEYNQQLESYSMMMIMMQKMWSFC
jgi:hypothetical protein